MNILWGLILFFLTSIAYFGQVVTALWPALAVKWGLTEAEAEVDPTFYADVRGEAMWDSLTLWTLPVAGLLLILENPLWAVFGLVGGAIYLYFAGRGIAVRLKMQREGIPIGNPQNVQIGFLFLALWGVAALVTIILALAAWVTI